jgi:low temperature requirement protein LtrA
MLIIGILLLIVGAILFFVSDQKAKAAPQNAYIPSFAGTSELLLGVLASSFGLVFTINSARDSIAEKNKAPKQVP